MTSGRRVRAASLVESWFGAMVNFDSVSWRDEIAEGASARDEELLLWVRAMKCPYCGFAQDRVVDSRESKEADAIRRRRECEGCNKRFTTYERIDEIPYMVVKKDGRREKFDRQKVLGGLLHACQKRPVWARRWRRLWTRRRRMWWTRPSASARRASWAN